MNIKKSQPYYDTSQAGGCWMTDAKMSKRFVYKFSHTWNQTHVTNLHNIIFGPHQMPCESLVANQRVEKN